MMKHKLAILKPDVIKKNMEEAVINFILDKYPLMVVVVYSRGTFYHTYDTNDFLFLKEELEFIDEK